MKLTVQQMSIIPFQSGIEFDTPKGRGTFEGITSSGLVKILVDGGVLEFSWSEVDPDLQLQHIELINKLSTDLVQYIFEKKLLPKTKPESA